MAIITADKMINLEEEIIIIEVDLEAIKVFIVRVIKAKVAIVLMIIEIGVILEVKLIETLNNSNHHIKILIDIHRVRGQTNINNNNSSSISNLIHLRNKLDSKINHLIKAIHHNLIFKEIYHHQVGLLITPLLTIIIKICLLEDNHL
jgi:hypothetical protein